MKKAWQLLTMRWTLILGLSLVSCMFVACDRKPQAAQASTQDNQMPQINTLIEEEKIANDNDSGENFTPSPRQDNEFLECVPPRREPMEMKLFCSKVTQAPEVDGKDNDIAWENAQPIQTLDLTSQRLIEMTAVHDGVNLYMRIKYRDGAPSITHKSWTWSAQKDFYLQGLDREDMFVIKWSMQGQNADISLRHAKPHTADIWFWKACRTNPMGYFDDKRHEMTVDWVDKSLEIKAEDGTVGHLRRIGDEGKQCYAELFPANFTRQYLPRYTMQEPEGSRGDVKGKGVWKDGYWTLECTRKLNTGHDDDLQMEQGGQYLFGVACYEIAGTPIDLSYSQPLYRTGDVYDRIILVVQ